MRLKTFLSLLLALAMASLPRAAAAADAVTSVAGEAVDNLASYLRIDTTNPPGRELAACRFLKALLDREGIPGTIYEIAPGRANLYAVLKGSDPKLGSFVLLSHSDVVPADARYWKHPPFSGAIASGAVWGRGALDMKGMGLVQLEAMVAAKRAGFQPKRDVVLLVVADEEMGGTGAQWMLEKHPELFKNVAGIINEEGPGYLENGRLKYWEVRPGQKALAWLKLIARGHPGHASMPFAEAAPNRLVRALNRVLAWETPIKILPEARQYFAQLAPTESPEHAAGLRDLDVGLRDEAFRRWFLSNRSYNAMVRNTVAITQLEGSNKTNVIPPQASAALDCRLLPGEDIKSFIETVRRVVDDPTIEIETLDSIAPVSASSLDTPLFGAITRVIRRYYPQAIVVTPYSKGANDSRYFQERGIVAYGFVPFAITFEEADAMHGNDERLSVASVREGVRMLFDLIQDFGGH